MASEKITALIEEVKALTVLELNDLVKALEEESGDAQYLDVSFTYEMGTALTGDESERLLQMAPLVVTLTTFLPETVAVRVRVNRRPIESIGLPRSACAA